MGNAFMTISGYLGNNPEQKSLQNGAAWTEFVVGMKSGYGEKEETNWIRCKVFGRLGESCLNNLLKGDYVTCGGEFEIRHYQKTDGTGGVSYDLKASSLVFGPKVQNRPPSGAYGQQPQQYQQAAYAPQPNRQPAYAAPSAQQAAPPAYTPPPQQAVPPQQQAAGGAPAADESDMPF